MARNRRVRKAGEEGVPKTLWLRINVIRRAEREARRQERSLSEFVNGAIAEKLDAIEIERQPVAA